MTTAKFDILPKPLRGTKPIKGIDLPPLTNPNSEPNMPRFMLPCKLFRGQIPQRSVKSECAVFASTFFDLPRYASHPGDRYPEHR